MMRQFNKCKVALVIASAMTLAACSDGKDGNDGAPGEPGPGPTPPSSETSLETSVNVLTHTLEEGVIKFELEITNEEDVLVTGLQKASVEFSELTDNGIARSRDGLFGGNANEATEGASLTETDLGRYEFVAPIENINAASEGIIRLSVGGSEKVASSNYIVVDKTDGIHTTSTQACYECHIDYAEFGSKHPHYTAINTDGEADFLGGCMSCHGNIIRDEGGYTRNTIQKIGHINHMNFEKGFEGSNCYSCHVEPVTATYSDATCSDCHQAAGMSEYVDMNSFAAGTDFRRLHTKFPEQVKVNEVHYSVMSEVVETEDGLSSCSTYSLYNTEGEEAVMLNAAEMVVDGDISLTITFQRLLHNIIDNASGTTTFTDNEDGSREYCIDALAVDGESFSALARTVFQTNEDDKVIMATLSENGRRLGVTQESCSTCHNVAGEYHRTAGFADGGASCLSCHYAGKDRRSAYSGPGFGPMIHSMHWGNGGEGNSADKLAAKGCVACHDGVIDLYEVPAQYMPSKSMNNNVSGVYTSQITANCAGCHTGNSARQHMQDNGGDINKPEDELGGDEWFLAPTSESCAVCHAEGKTFGIEKYHTF
ncbi:cytochrome c3 family protein [Shewanella maritima]|uniref:multiheme c-type cytochrome n=1 Tax=Shewanella maritima TaxID=2520507 RepID=UPI0037359B61